jgi:hypothetical protein
MVVAAVTDDPVPVSADRPDKAAGSAQGKARGPRRGKAGVTILPPIALPLDQKRRQRAVSALTALINQWWDEHGRHLPDPGAERADEYKPDNT